VVFTRQKIVFAVSQKKSKCPLKYLTNYLETLLDAMVKPAGYDGPSIEIVLKDQKAERDQMEAIVADVVKTYISGNRVALFQKNEQTDGALSECVLDQMKNYELQEMKTFMDQVNKVKIDAEVKNIKVASAFVEFSLRRMTKELKNCIEGDIKLRHNKISAIIESMLDDQDKMNQFAAKYPALDADSQLLEYSTPVLLQSGSSPQFILNKFDVESDDNKLLLSGQGQVFYMNICSKYSDMHAMACRTMIVNPLPEQKAAYQLAYDAQVHLFSQLKPGNSLKDVYNSTRDFIAEKDAAIAEKLFKNFGFGIGCDIKENLLEIGPRNETLIEPGMVFHVRMIISDGQIVVAIGDSVHVQQDGSLEQLTERAPRDYSHISFTLEVDDEEEDEAQENGRSTKPDSSAVNQLGNKRTRAGRATASSDKLAKEESIKKAQNILLEKQLENLIQRFDDGEIQLNAKKQKQK
jgi:nucleosome binding factor SPN SPT16 subunit